MWLTTEPTNEKTNMNENQAIEFLKSELPENYTECKSKAKSESEGLFETFWQHQQDDRVNVLLALCELDRKDELPGVLNTTGLMSSDSLSLQRRSGKRRGSNTHLHILEWGLANKAVQTENRMGKRDCDWVPSHPFISSIES